MSKRRSVAAVRKDSARVVAQTSELTDNTVRQGSYENHKINWDKCFICQRDSTEKLQSSLEALSTDSVKAYEELGDRILKFESLNGLPVPMEVDELSGGEALGTSLFNHSADSADSGKGTVHLVQSFRLDQRVRRSTNLVHLQPCWNIAVSMQNYRMGT